MSNVKDREEEDFTNKMLGEVVLHLSSPDAELLLQAVEDAILRVYGDFPEGFWENYENTKIVPELFNKRKRLKALDRILTRSIFVGRRSILSGVEE